MTDERTPKDAKREAEALRDPGGAYSFVRRFLALLDSDDDSDLEVAKECVDPAIGPQVEFMEFGFLNTAEWWVAAGPHVVGDSTEVVLLVCRNIEAEEMVIDKPHEMADHLEFFVRRAFGLWMIVGIGCRQRPLARHALATTYECSCPQRPPLSDPEYPLLPHRLHHPLSRTSGGLA